jgi:heme oxygenase
MDRMEEATPRVGLATALGQRTRLLHARAERSGYVREILRRRASRAGYALYLRNLLPAYRRLERELERHRGTPGVRAVAIPAVYRAEAMAADLAALRGPAWHRGLKLLPEGAAYARRVRAAAAGDGARLVAHAYTRHLADLSGGQILRRLLAGSLPLGPRALTVYDFAGIDDLETFKGRYRSALDEAGLELGDLAPVLEEAELAFRLNIELSEAVLAAAVSGRSDRRAWRGR